MQNNKNSTDNPFFVVIWDENLDNKLFEYPSTYDYLPKKPNKFKKKKM